MSNETNHTNHIVQTDNIPPAAVPPSPAEPPQLSPTTQPPGTPSAAVQPEPRLYIADVDVGVDDAWALFALLKAETSAHPNEHKLLAITCVNGNANVDQVAHNVARVLQVAERPDVPVYKGAAHALVDALPTDNPYHGHDGLGDITYNAASVNMTPVLATNGEHAVNAMHRLTNSTEYRNKITLICLAPLTNVALAIRMYGAAFVRNVRDIWIMGGNHLGVGNTPQRIAAEFNFYADPEAAYIVLEAFGAAGVPVHVLPWEGCSGKTLPVRMRWRHDVLGRVPHPVVRWLNPIEASIFGADMEQAYGMCDALLVGCVLWPERMVKRQRRRRCTVELQGAHTRGQMIVDHVNDESVRPTNVNVIELLDEEATKDLMMWVVDAATMDGGAVGNTTG